MRTAPELASDVMAKTHELLDIGVTLYHAGYPELADAIADAITAIDRAALASALELEWRKANARYIMGLSGV